MKTGNGSNSMEFVSLTRGKRGGGFSIFHAADEAAERSLKSQFVSVSDLSLMLRKSSDAIRALIKRDVIPAEKLGRNWIINLHAVDQAMKLRSTERN